MCVCMGGSFLVSGRGHSGSPVSFVTTLPPGVPGAWPDLTPRSALILGGASFLSPRPGPRRGGVSPQTPGFTLILLWADPPQAVSHGLSVAVISAVAGGTGSSRSGLAGSCGVSGEGQARGRADPHGAPRGPGAVFIDPRAGAPAGLCLQSGAALPAPGRAGSRAGRGLDGTWSCQGLDLALWYGALAPPAVG